LFIGEKLDFLNDCEIGFFKEIFILEFNSLLCNILLFVEFLFLLFGFLLLFLGVLFNLGHSVFQSLLVVFVNIKIAQKLVWLLYVDEFLPESFSVASYESFDHFHEDSWIVIVDHEFQGLEFKIEIIKESIRRVEKNEYEFLSIDFCVDKFDNSWESGILLIEILQLRLKSHFYQTQSVLVDWLANTESRAGFGKPIDKFLETLSMNLLLHSFGFVSKEVF
jgi:hypothetical protein